MAELQGSLHFVTESLGYNIQGMSLFKTQDGGVSWQNLTLPSLNTLVSLNFLSEGLGFVLQSATSNTLLKTTDGGATWTTRNIPIATSISSVHFLDANTGFVGGSVNNIGIILKTTDGGISWTTLSVDYPVKSILFGANNIGLAVCSNNSAGTSTVLKTTDLGINWLETGNFSSGVYGGILLNSLSFLDPSQVILVGSIGPQIILKSTDAGSTWQQIAKNPIGNRNLNALSFIDSSTGFGVGSGGAESTFILKTLDGGYSWSEIVEGSFGSPKDIFFVTATEGYIMGGTNILKTINGGLNWTPQTSGASSSLKSIYFVGTTGFVVGNTGLIRKTINGGATWNASTSGVTANLNAIHLFSATSGVVVGDNGTIQKTTDGSVWTTKTSGTTSNLSAVHFPSAVVGYAVGSNGKILKTTNGGDTWSSLISGTTAGFLSVFFTSDNAGYAGTTDAIYSTNDGGQTWISQTGGGLDIDDIFFPDPKRGIAVGNNSIYISLCSNPSIISSPQNQTLTAGETLVLSTTVSGNGTINYQWKKDGANVGSNSSTLTISNASVSDAGSYSVVVTDGCGTSTSSAGVVTVYAQPPAAQPASLTITGATSSSVSFSFAAPATAPTGYVVLRKATSAVTEIPPDGTTYAAGAAVGTSTVVFSGNGTTFTDNGLSAGNIYHYSVFTYNGSGSSINYLTSAPLTGTSLSSSPPAQPTSLSLTGATDNSALFSFTNANGADGYLVVRKAGTAPTETPSNTNLYLAGTTLGTSTVVYSGSENTFTDTGLALGTEYFYKVYSYKGSGLSTNYLTVSPLAGTSLSSSPTVQPTNLILTDATSSSASFSFTPANGTDGYLVVRKRGFVPSEIPSNANSYVAGAALGTSTVVYSGSGNTFSDTGLTTGAVYYYQVFSFKGAGVSTNYLTTSPLQGNALTAEPSDHVTNISFSSIKSSTLTVSFSNALGNPDGYLVLRKKDSAPTAVPADGGVYTLAATVGDAVVVSVGNAITINETGLSPGSKYYYIIFPYKGVGVSTNYLTAASSNNIAVVTTLAESPEAIPPVNVLFDSFTARWNPVVGGDKYSLDVSDKADFSTFLPGFEGKQTTFLIETVSGLNINTKYYYRVRSVNASGESLNSNVIEVRTQDVPTGTNPLQMSQPTYSSTFPSDEQSQKVTVTLSAGLGARVVKLFYRGIAAATFQELAATELVSNANQFEATITRQMLDDLGVEFYLKANDAAFSAESNKFTIRKSFSGLASPLIPISKFGGSLDTYQMISIPLALEDNLIQTIFGSVLGEYDDTQWRIVRYQNGGNVDFPTINKIELGKSYWFNSRESVSIKAGVGTVPAADQSNPFKLSLGVGWNQIASPYPFAIDWDDVLNANGNPTGVGKYKVYVQSTANFSESNSLQPFSGGFVFTDKAIDLSIPVTLKNLAGGRNSAKEIGSDIGNNEWMVSINLIQGKVVNPLGGVGMHPSAKGGKDDFDDITLPRFVKHLEFNTYHPEFFAPRFSKDIVETATEHVWDVTVESNFDGNDITLDWSAADLGSSNAQLLLYDLSSGVLIDMKTTSTYTVPDSEKHEFKILYYWEKKLNVEKLTTFGVPYPNPSADTFSFKIFSFEPTIVSLEIYNLLGQKVASQQFKLGGRLIEEIPWQAVDRSGSKLPTGIYMYKINSMNTGEIKRSGRLILH